MNRSVHIVKVEIASCEDLGGVEMVASSSCRLSGNVNFAEINILEQAEASITDAIENKERVYTTTLTYHTCDKTPTTDTHKVFRLTTIDGTQFLVGTHARPYAIIKESNPFPRKPGDNILKIVTVTWKALTPMLYITD